MIVTCASCLTKFYLDDSKVSGKGAKVRCSRCKNVFYVVPPPETKEEVIEDAESFAKFHEELIGPDQKEFKIPSSLEEEVEEEKIPSKVEREEEEASFLFPEKAPKEKVEPLFPTETLMEERAEAKPSKPKRMIRKERRKPSLLFALVIVLILLGFGAFYLWSELGSGSKIFTFFENPIEKVVELWGQIWGTEKEGLIVRDLNGYEEKAGEVSLYIIEGKVSNQSRFTKRHIKIRVAIFDQNKVKVAEKETFCGRIMSHEELQKLPPAFFKGEMLVRPRRDQEMSAPTGKAIPFMVIFKELSSQAKEFQVEIVGAPNL